MRATLRRQALGLGIFLGIFLGLGIDAASAAGKAALVIGNSAYRSAPPLANPSNDANDIAAMLRGLGFEVVQGVDLDRNGMADTVGRFARLVANAELAVVFYAGHGLQINGKNYLIPVDAKLEHPADLKFQAIDLDGLLEDMEARKGVNLIFLDACRDNPFTRSLTRAMGASRSTAVGSGLAGTQANVGTLIAFATQPNNVAADGDGRNSPFTTALVKHMATPDLEIRAMLTRVRNDVVGLTSGKQVPWDHSSLLGDVFLKASPKAAGDPPPGGDANPEIAFWQSVAGSKDAADFDAYLKQFPNGVFSGLAKLRIAALSRPARPAAPALPIAPAAVPGIALQAPPALGLRSFVPAEPRAWSSTIAVRADESVVATASDKGEIRLWDVREKSLRAVLRLHSEYLKHMEFTPDGRYLVSFGSEGKLAVWDVASGRLERSVDVKREYAWSMSIAENGAYAATLADNQVVLWSLPELRQVDTIAAADSNDFAVLSADGSIIVADDWGKNNEQVTIYDRLRKRVIKRLARGNGLYANKAHAIPGTQRVVISWSDGLLQAVDYTSGRVVWERREADTYPNFTISADGRIGVTNLYRTLAFWDPATGNLISNMPGSFGITVAGRQQVWATRAPFRSYNIETREPAPDWPLFRAGVGNVHFVDDGRKVLFQAGTRVFRFDLASGAIELAVEHFEGDLVPSDGGYALVSSERFAALDPGSLQMVKEQSLKAQIGPSVAVYPVANGGRHAVVSRKTGSKYEYELFDLAAARTVTKLGEKSLCQVFSPTGDRLVHQSADAKVDYRDMNGKVIRTLNVGFREKYDWISQCAISPNGRELVLATGKGQFIVYDLTSGKVLRGFQLGSDYFLALRVMPDGRTALVSQKGEMMLIDLGNGHIISRYGRGDYIRGISPDGKFFSAGSPDLSIQRIDTGETVATLQLFSDGAYAVRTAGRYSGSPGVERHFVLDSGDRIFPVPETFVSENRKADLSAEIARSLK